MLPGRRMLGAKGRSPLLKPLSGPTGEAVVTSVLEDATVLWESIHDQEISVLRAWGAQLSCLERSAPRPRG
jgi:hypothetical protein